MNDKLCIYKKWIWIVGMLLCFFARHVYAATDTVAPLIKSVKVELQNTDAGYVFHVEMDVEEEGTGMESVWVALHSTQNAINLTKDYSEDPQYTGKVTYTVPADVTMKSGTYYIVGMGVADAASNSMSYAAPSTVFSDNPDELVIDYEYSDGAIVLYNDEKSAFCRIDGQNQFEFSGFNGTDFRIHSINIENYKLTPDDSFRCELDIEGEDLIDWLQFDFENEQGTVYSFMEGINLSWERKDNTIYCIGTFDNPIASGRYRLKNILFRTSSDGVVGYSRESGSTDPLNGFGGELCKISGSDMLEIDSGVIDSEAPILKDITFLESEITKPGVFHIRAEFLDASDVFEISVIVGTGKEGWTEFRLNGGVDNSGTAMLTSSVPMKAKEGEYKIVCVGLWDKSNNFREYHWNAEKTCLEDLSHSDVDKVSLTKKNTLFINDEFHVSFDLGVNNPNLAQCAGKLVSGETGRVNVSSGKKVPEEVFTAIKGKDVKLILYNDWYQWVFDGKDISDAKTIDTWIKLTEEDGTEYGVSDKVLRFEFPDNGVLPGKAQIRVKSDYTKAMFHITGNAYLYYENPKTDTLELETDGNLQFILDDTDHWCYFTITHNSSFIVAGSKLKKSGETKPQPEVEKESSKKKIPKVGTRLTHTKSGLVYKVVKKGKEVTVAGISKQKKQVSIPKEVVLEKVKYKVTSIADNAFRKNKTITTVTIGSNVKKIGKKAFQSCARLKTVKGCKGETSIGASAFSGDRKLTSVAMGTKLTVIGEKAFYGCTALAKITIPAKTSKIGKSAFGGCKKLKTITIKSTKLTEKKVGAKAFTGTAAKATVKVPKKNRKTYAKWLVKKGISKSAKIK